MGVHDLDLTLVTALRRDLSEADYTVECVQELLGPRAAAALHREQGLPALRVLEQDSSVAAGLTRLFVLGGRLSTLEVDELLPRTGVAGALALGLVSWVDGSEDGGLLQARVDLRPYGQEGQTWWVASDPSEMMRGGPLEPDHVLGVGGASTTLASWTPRPPAERALDLGTGCGVQALHLASHVDHLVGTDISSRALAFARLNAALAGLDIDLRTGSLVEPVAGEEFELIVSNPPFVITPRTDGVPLYEYRDGGEAGDRLVAGLVAGLGAHLTPGGIAQLLGNWELGPGQDWREPVASWLDAAAVPVDAWVIQREVQDVAEYAETWIRDGGHRPGTAEFDRLYAAWLDDFEARGVERVGFGIITLQRPKGGREPWRDLMDVRGPVAAPMGPSILAGLAARTWLAEHDEDDLLAVPWQVAHDVTEERIGHPGAPDPQVIQLRQGGGLRRTLRLGTLEAGFVGACDGELTAAQLCAGLSAVTDTPIDEVRAEIIPVLRELVADGLVR